MSKITIYLCVGAGVVCMAIGGYLGRNLFPKTVEKVVTVERTVTIHDTVKLIKYSKGFTVVKHDTSWYQDTTTIASYEALIASMSEQSSVVDNPESEQLTPASSKPRLGLGLALGAEYFIIDGSVRPILQVPVRWKNWYVIGGLGFGEKIVPDKYQLSLGCGW
jgi:hypothetical protein